MKKLIAPVLIIAFLVIACAFTAPTSTTIVIVVTATPQSAPINPLPLPTLSPTTPPQPTQVPITILDIEKALKNDGYTRSPFDDPKYGSGYGWTKDNPYEEVITWDNGHFRLEVLDVSSPTTRSKHMEEKFKVLDTLFSPEFMTELRQKNDTYNQSVGPSVSGDPAYLAPSKPGDQWNTVWGEYNVSSTSIESMPVTFALWFYQITCPPQYSYCYMTDFPGQEFTGETSFVFYTIEFAISPLSSTGNG
jgi:hypothetical protein